MCVEILKDRLFAFIKGLKPMFVCVSAGELSRSLLFLLARTKAFLLEGGLFGMTA